MTGSGNEVKTATFGAGCFWGVEAAFRKVQGVTATAVGYMGGSTKNPTYEQVCSGETGHAEVVQVTYDPARVTYDELLSVFWSVHNPTQLNRQGPDVGSNYRSVIFYHDAEQGQDSPEIQRRTPGLRQVRVWQDRHCHPAGNGVLAGRRVSPAVFREAWRSCCLRDLIQREKTSGKFFYRFPNDKNKLCCFRIFCRSLPSSLRLRSR